MTSVKLTKSHIITSKSNSRLDVLSPSVSSWPCHCSGRGVVSVASGLSRADVVTKTRYTLARRHGRLCRKSTQSIELNMFNVGDNSTETQSTKSNAPRTLGFRQTGETVESIGDNSTETQSTVDFVADLLLVLATVDFVSSLYRA